MSPTSSTTPRTPPGRPAVAPTAPRARRGLRSLVLALGVLLAVTTLAGPQAVATGPSPARATVVLVHGAWADSSGWTDVVHRLQRAGHPVVAVANPLRSLQGDAAYVRSVTDQVDGPVVLVGHSYGGAVITNAASGSTNVTALVYVAGFVPDVGEDVLHIAGAGSQVPVSLDVKAIPPFGEADGDIYIARDRFRSTLGADLTSRQTQAMWATQRPLAYAAASAPTTSTAWRELPSWSVVPTEDRTITPPAHRSMAARAGATVVEVRSSHLVHVSRPQVVADVVRRAADATA